MADNKPQVIELIEELAARELPVASTQQKGVMQVGIGLQADENGVVSAKLNNTLTSTSTVEAATANTVRQAYNSAVAAQASADNAVEFEAGTSMLFAQDAAPAKWYKCTDLHDAAIRLTNGNDGGTGFGGNAFNNAFRSSYGVSISAWTDSHVLSEQEMPAHNHTGAYWRAPFPSGSWGDWSIMGFNWGNTDINAVPTSGSSWGHSHAIGANASVNLNVKTLNVIRCIKS